MLNNGISFCTGVLVLTLVAMNSQFAFAEWQMIDNFDGRTLGSIDGQGEWVVNEFGSLGVDAFEVVTDPTDPMNQVFTAVETAGNDATVEDGYFTLTNPLDDGATGTLYFRFRTSEPAGHVNFGLSDVEDPTGEWNHFEAQIRDNQLGGLDFRDGGGFTNVLEELPSDEWISIWMVIDNADDITRNYIQSEMEFSEQTRLTAGDQDEFLFRFGTDEPLINFFIRAGADHFEEWYLDDIYLDLDGENLTVPMSGPMDPLAPLNDGSLTDGQARADYVHDVLNTWIGDSNLDGEFNSGDLVVVFGVGQYEDDVEGNSSWETGDWNGDKEFDTGDLVTAFTDGGFEQGARQATNAVPEPGSLLLAVFAAIGVIRSARHST